MNRRARTLGVLTLAATCLLAPAPAADAATTHSNLRVEAIDRTLDPGTNYSNASITTRNTNACGPRDSRRERLRGANAMGLVAHAANVNGRLSPFRTTDTFDQPGAFACQIDRYKGFRSRVWLYKVNHESPDISASRLRVGRGDEVLWFFANFDTGRNTGNELDLRGVPARVRPGQRFTVRVVQYDLDGKRTPAAGARVTGAAAPTSASGRTTVIARGTPGTMRVKARRGDDIPTAALEVCVARNLSRCPDRRGETFIGTGRADAIRATDGPDTIRPRGGRDDVAARGGADLIVVRGGGRDRVNCGPGRDRVQADRRDVLRGNCER